MNSPVFASRNAGLIGGILLVGALALSAIFCPWIAACRWKYASCWRWLKGGTCFAAIPGFSPSAIRPS